MRKLNYIIGCVLVVFFFSQKAQAQASCATAFDLGTDIVGASCGTGVALDATIEAGWTGSQCGAVVQSEIWITFTITDGGLPNIQIDVDNTSFAAPEADYAFGFQVFTGACGALTLLDCDNDEVLGIAETETLYDLPNGTYYVRLIGYGNLDFDFEICVTQVDDPPANDDCADAIPVTVGADGICTEVTGTNVGATDSGEPAPSCASYMGGDVWFSITVPASGNVTFATDYSVVVGVTDLGMSIYSGACGSLTELECDDDDGNGLMSSISATGLTPGATIYVRIWEYLNDEFGTFDLCFSEPPVLDNNQDCETSTGLCTDTTINGASNGAGLVVDLNLTNQGCMSVEHQSSWYDMQISTAGTFEFIVSPNNGTDDYDIAVWVYPGGTGEACPPAVAPTRCTWAAGGGDTGLQNGSGDTTEDDLGDKFVDGINVNPGDVIVVLIDNFSSTTSPFTLNFTGTAGLDCVVLPVELMTFYGELTDDGNRLHWQTASEYNNDYFTIEHSMDIENWRVIGSVNGSGTTTETQHYAFDHTEVLNGTNYYKLYQTDIDGTEKQAKIIALNNNISNELIKTINLMGQEVNVHYKGIVIDLFSDGSSVKRLQ